MGTRWTLRIVAISEPAAEGAAARAFARIGELDRCMTDYDPNSEARSLGEIPMEVSKDLWDVLSYSRALAEETGGAFDVNVGELTRLWRRALRRGQLPREEAFSTAFQVSGYASLRLEPTRRTVTLTRGGRIDLGAIGKGVALDAALAILIQADGVVTALVDAGGDVLAGPPPKGKSAWEIAVVGNGEPFVVAIANGAVATSGDLHQYAVIGGERYSHLIDPRSGRALRGSAAATVIAETGREADALASALCVLPLEEGVALVEKREGAAARVTRQLPLLEDIHLVEAGGFQRFVRP